MTIAVWAQEATLFHVLFRQDRNANEQRQVVKCEETSSANTKANGFDFWARKGTFHFLESRLRAVGLTFPLLLLSDGHQRDKWTYRRKTKAMYSAGIYCDSSIIGSTKYSRSHLRDLAGELWPLSCSVKVCTHAGNWCSLFAWTWVRDSFLAYIWTDKGSQNVLRHFNALRTTSSIAHSGERAGQRE